MATIKLQGIYGELPAKEVAELKIGDTITWNFGFKSTVVDMIPSKTGKSVTLMLKSEEDGIVRERKMRVTTLVAVEEVEEAVEEVAAEQETVVEETQVEEPKKATKTITKYYTKAWFSGWHECTKEEADERIERMLKEAPAVCTEEQKERFIARHYKEEVVEVEVEEQEEPQEQEASTKQPNEEDIILKNDILVVRLKTLVSCYNRWKKKAKNNDSCGDFVKEYQYQLEAILTLINVMGIWTSYSQDCNDYIYKVMIGKQKIDCSDCIPE